MAGRLPPGSPASEQGVHSCLLKCGASSAFASVPGGVPSTLYWFYVVEAVHSLYQCYISMGTPHSYLFFNDGRPMSEFLVAYTRL